jgi:TrpR-related protein YerC/YecD
MKYLNDSDKNELYRAILALRTEDECRRFLRDLLTETEVNEFTNRWKVAHMLYMRQQYKEIEESTGMSSATVARISKWLTDGMGGYQLVLKRLYANNNEKQTALHHHNRLKAE